MCELNQPSIRELGIGSQQGKQTETITVESHIDSNFQQAFVQYLQVHTQLGIWELAVNKPNMFSDFSFWVLQTVANHRNTICNLKCLLTHQNETWIKTSRLRDINKIMLFFFTVHSTATLPRTAKESPLHVITWIQFPSILLCIGSWLIPGEAGGPVANPT